MTIVSRTPFIHFRTALSTSSVVTPFRIASMSKSCLEKLFAVSSSTLDNDALSAVAALMALSSGTSIDRKTSSTSACNRLITAPLDGRR